MPFSLFGYLLIFYNEYLVILYASNGRRIEKKKYMNKKTKDNLDISKFNLEEFDDLNVYSTSLIMSFHFSPKKIY